MTSVRVADVMTESVETVRENDTVANAAQRMAQANVGAIPVISDTGELRGIITDRDIVVRAIAERKDPSTTKVGEIDSSDIEAVSPDDPIDRATQLMRSRQVRRLPVTRGKTLVGMVSQADIARQLPSEETGSVVADISEG